MALHSQDEPTSRLLRIGAALFNGDHTRLGDEIRRLEDAGVDFVHLDVFDGHFVGDLGFSPHTIAALRPLSDLPFEVHLGAVEPLRFVPALVDAGVDLILFHAESVDMVYEAVYQVHAQDVEVGLAFTLGTPLAHFETAVEMLDAVLFLSRVTGEGTLGATFNPLVVPRVRAARRMVEEAEAELDIQVAGSVKRQHVTELYRAGMDSVAIGGGLYRVPDMAAEVQALRAAVGEKV